MGWPYPRIVAHRGGGALAPENTLAALERGAALGFRGVEFDVMLAGDATAVLIHDETTTRTTGVEASVPHSDFSFLRKIGIPSFDEAARLCRKLGLWANVEIKPAKGHEVATGAAVARLARELFAGAAPRPVLSSFSIAALEAARAADGEAALGFLVDDLPQDWKATAARLGCVSVHCNQKKIARADVAEIEDAGYGVLCWTVNEPARARELLSWGVDCLVTDALEAIGPAFS
ncbi:MAG TPA: glycerophosphodiester phosphodiesterase [Burkholderiales bacterium]|nr:glycerophosphodiester phosphodiesterase [Burkholderiales bacterium]